MRARSTAAGVYLPSGGDPFATIDYIASVGPPPGTVYGDAIEIRVAAGTPVGDYVVEVETNRKSDDVQPDNWVSIGQILVHVGPAHVVAHGSASSDSGTAVAYDSLNMVSSCT